MSKDQEWLKQQDQEDQVKEDIMERLEEQDNINNPYYYNLGEIQPIEVVEDWDLGYHLGTVIKYIARAGFKEESTELEDLLKAQWFLNRKIMLLEVEKESRELLAELGAETNHMEDLLKQEENKEEVKSDSPLQKLVKALGIVKIVKNDPK